MKRLFWGKLLLSAILLLALGGLNSLHAGSGRAPISGTPLLREHKRLLLRDYGPPARTRAELLGAGETIRADMVGQQVSFWAFDFGTQQFYQTAATCRDVAQLTSGYFLFIYVEDAEFARDPARYSASTLTGIRHQYIDTILPTETLYFGSPPTGNFTILLMDIRDGGGDTYVSGYFDSRNEINTSNSNFSHHQHMIYMDSREGNPTSISFLGTFAHEFQHFIHFSYDPNEETWVEEGLSGLARYVCGYGHQATHVNAFGLAPTTSLTSWQDELADYGATYLFMLYLNEQFGGGNTNKTTKLIVANSGTGISGINSALFSKGYQVTVNDILKKWVVANYLNNLSISNGVYGYQASFSATDIIYSPGNIQVTSTIGNYPATGGGTTNQYAADYVKFINLGGTYDVFVLIPYSLTEGTIQSYSYTGKLGSFILNLTGISPTQGMSGVKLGTSDPAPIVVSPLSASNSIDTGATGGGGGSGGSDGGGGGGCFIATAAYGSSLSSQVSTLRQFRDRYLRTNLPGRIFLSVYYRISPPVAHFISEHESLKALTRMILYPVVGLSRWFLLDPKGAAFLGVGTFLLVGLILIRSRKDG
jgi:hypothetical protein